MNRKVFITGASRGIGRSIAREFAACHDDLFLVCHNNIEDLQKYADELQTEFGITTKAFKCDVGNFQELSDVFSKINDVDIVINNAGIAWMGLLSDMEVAEWKNLMATNLDALFYTAKLAVPMMVKKQSGRIINISSVWGNVGASCEVAYSASKGGVNSFTKALAKELAPSGIAVNAIACGVIDTDINRQHLTEDDLEELRQDIPMDRLGTPEDVANLVVKVSEAPLYMTGQILTIDGGWI